MTTQENFLSNCETCRRVIGFPDDVEVRNLISVPMFHVTGCNSQLLITEMMGGTVVIMPAFEVQAFLRATVDERINVLTSVPAIYWLAMNQPNFGDFDVDHVRWVAYGGAPTPPDVIARLRTAFPSARLGNGFGLTETSSVSTFLPDEYCEQRPETVGFAAPVVEVDLLDVDAGGVGELLIRGQNIVAGYWNKPEQTAETFVDGWLHTRRPGPDRRRRLRPDRRPQEGHGEPGRRERLLRGGRERARWRTRPCSRCAVVGVPDTMMGEKVGAIVVLGAGHGARRGPDLIAFARERLADFKVPQYVAFRAEPLPRNPGGKVLKPVLRKETEWGSALR